MLIGIGLPSTVSGATGGLLRDWARKAETRRFSSLAVIDRLAYHNYDPLVTLAAAAGVTTHIRLMTSILIAPLRGTALMAKQAASLDALSNGRLTLGLAIGSREDDYLAAQMNMKNRGRRFDGQLETMKRIWSGQPFSAQVGKIGPATITSGGPEILIGGRSPQALSRVGRWGDGFISGSGATPQGARQFYELARQSWQAERRTGEPRFVAASYFALGPEARQRGSVAIRDYYGFSGPYAEHLVSTLPSSVDEIQALLQAFEAVGVDEFILWPTIAVLEQVDQLAEATGI